MTASGYNLALLRAAELLGGRDKLTNVLRVPKAELDQRIGGVAKPPPEVFLQVVELILDETGPAGGPDDATDPPPHDAAGSSQRYRD